MNLNTYFRDDLTLKHLMIQKIVNFFKTRSTKKSTSPVIKNEWLPNSTLIIKA